MIYREMTQQQLEACNYAYERDYSLLRLPTGFGKTVVALTCCQWLLEDRVVSRVLVLAPLRVIEGTWREEPGLWDHVTVDVAYAIGNEKARRAALASDARVVVMNYENVKWWKDTYGKDHGFDGIIYDEITRLKLASGRQFKTLRHLYKTFKWRCGMGARSDSEGLEDLYAQVLLMDNGERLGRSKDAFLNRWFIATDYNQYNWEPREGSREELAKLTSEFTFAPDPQEYDDSLPPLFRSYHGVTLPEEARRAYDDMTKHLVVEAHGISAPNAAVATGKLQQVCSGFLYDDDDVVWLHDEKKKKVQELVADCTSPVLISYWYEEELAMLKELFPDAPVVGKECTHALVRKWNRGVVPIMLIHPRSGGHGLNIQYGGHTLVMLGPVWSNDLNHQLISRLRRRGQPAEAVRVMVIVAEDTVEVDVMIPRVEGKEASVVEFGRALLKAAGE
jgi:hypothetical protein